LLPSVSVDRNPPDSGLCFDRVRSVITENLAGPLLAGFSSFQAVTRRCLYLLIRAIIGGTNAQMGNANGSVHSPTKPWALSEGAVRKDAQTAAPDNRAAVG